MKKMLLVLSFAIVLPFATLAHASSIVGGSNSSIVGGSNSNIVGGSNSSIVGGSNASASWLSILWQGLVSIVGGSN
jgi:hypothetical protein